MYSCLGALARDQGDYGRAMSWLEAALRLAQQLGDREGLNGEQHELGELMLLLGDDARAWDLQAASLAGFRERGNKLGMEMALINLGYVARHLGKQGQAAAMYLEALAIADERGDRGHTIECLAGLAGLAEPSRAARLFGAAEALREVDRSQPVLARRREIERNLVAARAQLDPDAWDAAWAEGRAMTLEQAVAYALEETGPR
jgi:tetratricopeptide (TPR) repeat protein